MNFEVFGYLLSRGCGSWPLLHLPGLDLAWLRLDAHPEHLCAAADKGSCEAARCGAYLNSDPPRNRLVSHSCSVFDSKSS